MANTHSIDLELSSSQYLSITDGDQTGLDVAGDITLECWIKLEQLPSTAGTNFVLISKYLGTDGNRGYSLQIVTTDKLIFTISDNGNALDADLTQFISDSAVVVAGDVGNWIHIAATFTSVTPTMDFYKNGAGIAESINGSRNGANSIYNNTIQFNIGAEGSAPVNYFDGLIDEVRVWNDVRTSTEISDNYQKELIGNEAGLVGYWKVNNSLLDETSNNNDLTNNNSAVFSTSVPFTGVVQNSNFFLMM